MRKGISCRPAAVLAVVGSALAAATSAAALPTLTTHSKSTSAHSGRLTATAKCSAGEHVVSGGYAATKTVPPGALVASHAVAGKGWTVVMYPYFAERLTVYAYCARNGKLSASQRKATAKAAQAPALTTATASCHTGQASFSGGFAFQHATLSESNSSTYDNYSADERSWSVTSAFATTPAQLATFAYCGRGLTVTARTATSPSPAHTMASATASCDKGETLLSGGFSTDPTPDWNNTTGPDTYSAASYRSAVRSWTVTADNYSDVAGTITTFAYCARRL
jgi:hypothetical protein